MEPAQPAPSGGRSTPKLSSVVLMAMAAIAVIVIASIFGYILLLSGMRFDSQLWWMGLVSLIFALVFYMLYAATHDRRITRPLAGAFFVIGVGSYYASILSNPDEQLTKLVWLVVFSILVVIVLASIFLMARDKEKDAIRKSQRKVTP